MQNKKSFFPILAALLISVGALLFFNRAAAAQDTTWADVLAEADTGGYQLITAQEVWQRYQKAPDAILLVDTRQAREYRTGHIKGALSFPMEPTQASRRKKQGALESFLGPDKNLFLVFYSAGQT